MGEELERTARTGDIDAFYGVVEREPEIHKVLGLEETPLHVAVGLGQAELAIEILSLMPSFGKKLNPSGYSPLDLALRNGHRETAMRLIKFDPKLIGVQSRERKTSLHYLAETDDIAELLAEFLVACPTAAKELTIREETAVHLAVLRGNMSAFKVLMDWITRTGNQKMLKWKDNKGNTVLHIAAQTSQVEVVERFIKEKVYLNYVNGENETALDIVSKRISSPEYAENSRNNNVDDASDLNVVVDDIANQEDTVIQKMLVKAGALNSSEFSVKAFLTSQKGTFMALTSVDLGNAIADDTRNMFLVVTVLILTATFQAVLSPPGGGWRKEDNNSYSLLPAPAPTTTVNHVTYINNKHDMYLKDLMFYPFMVVNSFSFFTSLGSTVILIPFRRYSYLLVLLSLHSLMASYVICALLMAPQEKLPLTVCILSVTFTVIYVLYYRWLNRPGRSGIACEQFAGRFCV